ncbi:D-alanyl-D-alanine carboxypeptidase PBP6B [Acinetobacter baumannii]|uniref:D-alanyl-D-alanine carboxypeptidase PBP6B n=1 Tax=Acinetobacter baumannii TaxID=470 RepID=UPI000C998946|nr:D-alanyl-D-alanine carboxypeptidase PBP6B [Acinetobacter baumannii]MDT1909583.1 D-alanyl-D-alanine carboxypeptidase PBP6B [Acinetobacter baumannii]PNC60633.1 D-alanyl-D-alanine carboxypeptidase [Acinetobacter baumannii]
MKFFLSLFTLFSIFCTTLTNAALLNIAPESVEAAAWTIVDTQSGQIIAEHNSHVQRAPASLTKMMVAYIALKEIKAGKLKLNEVITATPVVSVVQWDESQMYLKAGEQISVDQLLAGLIVMSANDAAVTLAEKISGDVPHFVQRMNQEAQALGMKDTHFSNPAGITMPDHYTTAHDLSLLSQAVIHQTPEYLHYSKMPSFSYNQRFHHATNLALKYDPSVDGLKTGYTKAAGYNLALTASRPSFSPNLPQRRLLVIVLGTPSAVKRAEIADKLMNLAYAYTRDEVVIPEQKLIAELPVIKSTLKMFKVETKQPTIVTTSLYAEPTPIDLNTFDYATQRIQVLDSNQQPKVIAPLETTQTRVNIQLNEQKLTAPLMKAMNLATVSIYQNNQLIRSLQIENDVHIEEANIFQRIMMWFSSLFSLFSSSEHSAAKLYPIDSH